MQTPDIIRYVCWAAFLVAIVAFVYMYTQYRRVKNFKFAIGTEPMQELAAKIRNGAKRFVEALYKWIVVAGLVLFLILIFVMGIDVALLFLFGLTITAIAELIGMSIATLANVRTAATAYEFRDLPLESEVANDESYDDKAKAEIAKANAEANAKINNTAITASQICGLAVMTAGIIGVAFVVLITPWSGFFAQPGKTAILIVKRVTGHSLGWSIMAMFARVPGGIFTKAADEGADLIGKVFMHFKEDDARNPAVLADFIGDNVNDIKGNMADLGESFVATPVTAIIAAVVTFGNPENEAVLTAAVAFPFILMIAGLIGSIVGLFYASHARKSKNPERQINASLFIAAGFAMVGGLVGSMYLFKGSAVPGVFKYGAVTGFICDVLGIAAGVVVGFVSKYFTDLKSRMVAGISQRAKQSNALAIVEAQVVGWISVPFEVIIVAIAAYVAGRVGDTYGSSIMAAGLLSFIAQPIAADAFGPIADNAGGIVESCDCGHRTRSRTDIIDAFGNSSAAVGKAFAICSAAAVVLTQIKTFSAAAGIANVNLLNGDVQLGNLIGGALMAFFCGLLWKYTNEAANEMAAECKKQFARPEVVNGQEEPDSEACVTIATNDAVKRTITPVVVVIAETLLIGFIFGPYAMAGCLQGTSLVGIILAIYFSNAGGAADNAKKRYEAGLENIKEENFMPGTEEFEAAHDATVACDTVGDGQKDVVAVSCDIFMKIMGTLATMMAPMFSQYALLL